jgi:outer membrane protein
MLICAFIASILSVVLSVNTFSNSAKVAFINSSILVERYYGFIEIHQTLDKKVDEWNLIGDSIYAQYIRKSDYLNNNRHTLKPNEIDLLEKELSITFNEYSRYQNEIEERAKNEYELMTKGAFNQINSFIESYSQANGIDIVIGITSSGNMLYGSERIDITYKVLEELNQTYK